mmetsp:Transcript_3659/g.8600  ORF Transcript_3659/g.8600 Transcript_3659/m.8600 type:complete len:855 (-) Transcript_3659:13-2577(-)
MAACATSWTRDVGSLADSTLAVAAGVTADVRTSTLASTLGRPEHTETFRSHNVRFLQQQNQEATTALDRLEGERDEALATVARWEQKTSELKQQYSKLNEQLDHVNQRCHVSAAEIETKNEQIRVLSEQNRSLLDMLEEEEKIAAEREASVLELSSQKDQLQQVSDQYDNIKETGNTALTSAFTEIAKFEEELRNAENETMQLKEAEANFAAQAKVDIDALEKKLTEAKKKNVEHLQQIQHNEVFEHRMVESIQRLKETLDELTVQKKGIRMQLDMDVEHREKWTQSKTEVERRRETLERTVAAFRQSLKSAEEENTRMQEENKLAADQFRQLGDKVYALMDQLRQNQLDLKKAETTGTERGRRVVALDRETAKLQQNLQIEVDAKLAAEAEARNAAQMQALLQKKNRMLEDAFQLALKAQDKVEKRLQDLKEKGHALQTQNDYLTSRIDGNEEDKGALRYELRRLEEECRQAVAVNAQLTQQRSDVDDKFADLEADRASVKAELDYIKREDMLDETGRTKPILIESDSKLVERLQINEFLYSAQQARNPVPMLVEKVSHVLEMLHTAQTQADFYLQDLQRSNSMLTALRHKNMALYERVQMCETWKMRALLKIASNAFEVRQSVKGHTAVAARGGQNLYLDGLQYGNKELQELHKVIVNYGKADNVKEIRLQDNNISKACLPAINRLIELCAYMTRLDLRRNRLNEDAVSDLLSFIERVPGVTSISQDPGSGDIRAKSGNVVRLVVNIEDQRPPDDTLASAATEELFGEETMAADADAFLNSAAGVTAQTRLQGPEALSGMARTVMPAQRGAGATNVLGGTRGGLGESRSETTLPFIEPGAGTGRLGSTRGRR